VIKELITQEQRTTKIMNKDHGSNMKLAAKILEMTKIKLKVGDKVEVPDATYKNKIGIIKSINKEQAEVDFGSGDIAGITLRRIKRVVL
jgi:transcription antitermination factor NusG